MSGLGEHIQRDDLFHAKGIFGAQELEVSSHGRRLA
jgi:hypothetical protein